MKGGVDNAQPYASQKGKGTHFGLDRLKALHLNDSKNPCGAHKDRHEKLGQGCLGLELFRRILHHPALRGLPMILETPNELPGYAQELALLRALGCI